MENFIRRWDHLFEQVQTYIFKGDDQSVNELDVGLQQLTGFILGCEPRNQTESRLKMQFLCTLICQNAADEILVTRYTRLLSDIISESEHLPATDSVPVAHEPVQRDEKAA